MALNFILLAVIFTILHMGGECDVGFIEGDKKIAFLFMARGHMPLEDIWREFFGFQANASHYSIYVHPHHGFKYHKTSFFYGREIPHIENVKWGGMGQVRGIKNLVREALLDPLNDWFCLMSETCIPLHPFPVWRQAFQKQSKSMINACAMDPSEMETDTRWRPSLDQVGMVKSQWRKSATWFGLNRKHSKVFVDEIALEKGWESVPCCDEHYLPSILAYNKLDNETTCTDGFAHVHWDSLVASHPHLYGAEEVTIATFNAFNKQVGAGAGFSQLCSGNSDICHFTSRKFSGNAKYALLENIDLILNDNKTNTVYNNDQWGHFNEKLRVDRNGSDSKYFLIENSYLRSIPDLLTLTYMHLNHTLAQDLTDLDRKDHPLGIYKNDYMFM